MTRRSRSLLLLGAVGLVPLIGLGVWLLVRDTGDPALKPFVRGKPPFPIVFTSRSEPVSFRAASTVGEGFAAPGVPQWQAREGRLRVLTTGGAVRELTWGKSLPDGAMLVDVMSPSVGPDGTTVVFAGRRPNGRFRIYRTSISGGPIEQLTGGPDDPGCVAAPPMRLAENGSRLSADGRRRADYDDVDPVELPGGGLVFASSRLPDLGGSADRRATQIWIRAPGQPPRTLSASRANDRWPAVDIGGRVTFTLWSRMNEVVAADGVGLAGHDPAMPGSTAPPNNWAAVAINATGEAFGLVAKTPDPVWRGRYTGSGRLAFMTPARPGPVFVPGAEHPEREVLVVASAAHGTLTGSPSSLVPGRSFPASDAPGVTWAPRTTSDGRAWSLATPAPCPPNDLVLAAAPVADNGRPDPGTYGLYLLAADDWPADRSSGAVADLRPLFDDPALVDSEPVAAYSRAVPQVQFTSPVAAGGPKEFALHGGRLYQGEAGEVHAQILFRVLPPDMLPGQRTDVGTTPAVPAFDPKQLTRIDFYATHRDRFDDPDRPRVRGTFEKIMEAPVSADGEFRALLPIGSPTVLVGVRADGTVATAEGAADRSGVRGKFYAFAGDHVSGVRPGGYHFCTGCHAGHTVVPADLRERVR